MTKRPLMKRRPIGSVLLTTKSIQRDWPELLAIAGLLLILGGTAGRVGIGAGVLTAAVWYRFGVPFTLAIGHLLLIVVYPNGITRITILLIESAFFALILLPVIRPAVKVETAVVSIVSLVILCGGSWIGLRTNSIWLAAGLCIGALSIGLYLGHRHALISLGLVPDSDTEDEPHSDIPQSTDE